jgi:hypothetical protein
LAIKVSEVTGAFFIDGLNALNIYVGFVHAVVVFSVAEIAVMGGYYQQPELVVFTCPRSIGIIGKTKWCTGEKSGNYCFGLVAKASAVDRHIPERNCAADNGFIASEVGEIEEPQGLLRQPIAFRHDRILFLVLRMRDTT